MNDFTSHSLRILKFIIWTAIGFALTGVLAKVGAKLNSKANGDVRASFADIEIGNQLRRIADAAERAHPKRRLPYPSLLHHMDLKPIPPPDIDPDPCEIPDRTRLMKYGVPFAKDL